MKERPILMSAPMVRAILAGTKTQTRRVAKGVVAVHSLTGEALADIDSAGPRVACPYGQPGDRLWVRENGWERPHCTQRMLREGADTWPRYEYDAEPVMCWEDGELKRLGWKRRPSIHMPRWASRITLEITEVRVERLQDISEGDAQSEGMQLLPSGVMWTAGGAHDGPLHAARPQWAFRRLWESINGPGSWEANPWVWAVSFKRVEAQ